MTWVQSPGSTWKKKNWHLQTHRFGYYFIDQGMACTMTQTRAAFIYVFVHLCIFMFIDNWFFCIPSMPRHRKEQAGEQMLPEQLKIHRQWSWVPTSHCTHMDWRVTCKTWTCGAIRGKRVCKSSPPWILSLRSQSQKATYHDSICMKCL